jgi:hypothetical protein
MLSPKPAFFLLCWQNKSRRCIMPIARLRFVKQCIQLRDLVEDEVRQVPNRTRGVYALYKKSGRYYDVLYIGMAGGPRAGVRGRLRDHLKNEEKRRKATHFSVFEVHDNISEEEVRELEGLLRHIFARDQNANRLATQKTYEPLGFVETEDWKQFETQSRALVFGCLPL